MFKKLIQALTVVLIISITSCASIIHGPTQSIDIKSNPGNARIFIDGKEMGQTPTSLTLNRKGRSKSESKDKKSYDLRIELEGYQAYQIEIRREMDGWFLGNILFGGIIGVIVDASNGSMYKLTPDQIYGQLGKSTAQIDQTKTELILMVTMESDPSWERIDSLNKPN